VNILSQVGESDNCIVGGVAAGYAVWKRGTDGTYFTLHPELTYLGGDVDVTSVKTRLMGAAPCSQDGKRWRQVKIENTYTKYLYKILIQNTYTKVKIDPFKTDQDDTVVWFLYKVFFRHCSQRI